MRPREAAQITKEKGVPDAGGLNHKSGILGAGLIAQVRTGVVDLEDTQRGKWHEKGDRPALEREGP